MTTINKRIRKLKDGSKKIYWEARVALGKRGTRKVFKGPRKKDVEEKVREYLRAENIRAPLAMRTNLTIEDLVQSCISESLTVTETTRRTRKSSWLRRKGEIGELPLHRLDVARVREWAAELQQTGKIRDSQRAWEALKLACDVAVADGLLMFNPVVQAKRFKPRAERRADDGQGKHRIKVYTREEIEALKEAANRERLGGLVHLLFDTGLRLGEALGLQWRDIESEILHVRRQLWEDVGKLELRAEKTVGSRRSIFIAPTTVTALGSPKTPMEQVFQSRNGKLQRKRAIYTMWQRVHRNAGVERDARCPHCARHTHATILLAEGTPIPDVSRRLGHDSIQTTLQFYGAWLPGEDRTKEAVLRLSVGK